MTQTATTILQRPEECAHADFAFVVRRMADDLAFGSDNSLFLGNGLEYASSRPYQPGDSIRAMHWRLTARAGTAFVKEYEALKRTCVYIVVDRSASMAVTSTLVCKLDLATWIAAALGLVAQRRLSPVSIVSGTAAGAGERVGGERGAGARAPRRAASLAQHDLWHGLEPLRRKSFTQPAHVGKCILDVMQHARRASVIIAISDWHDPDAVPAIRRAAQRHDCIALHTIDPSEQEPLHVGFFRGRESETGRTFLGRPGVRWPVTEEVQRDLARCGVDYLCLRTDRPFIAPLRHFLALRGSALRGRA